MEDERIMSAAVDALVEKERFRITIPVTWFPKQAALTKPRGRNLWNRLYRLFNGSGTAADIWPEVETERTFIIYPCKTANMYRIASTAVKLPNEVLVGRMAESIIPLMCDEQHIENIRYMIAAGIQNNHLEPEPALLEFLRLNLDEQDMFLLLHHTLDNLGMESFLNSIVLARGTVKILKPETSPDEGRE